MRTGLFIIATAFAFFGAGTVVLALREGNTLLLFAAVLLTCTGGITAWRNRPRR